MTTLIGKTLRYLRKNGLRSTIKKILRRLRGNNWLPAEEDHLYLQTPCTVQPHERWEMPKTCVPYDGKVSVVIPTYNGADELPPLLTALKQQTQISDLEIVIIDSGSKDGTPELAMEAGAKVIRIKQEDFTHSYSRTLGAEHATGEYLLFMTQDALPDREDWIIRMLQPCLVSGAAAVSCYETPKPDADLFCHISVHNWKLVMGGDSDKLTQLPENGDYEELRRSAQLSDNACLIKRSIFMEIGGHRGAYAEDLDLGYRLLKAGHKLGILSSISVVHSHNRPASYNFKRSIVDGIHIAGIFENFSLEPIGIAEASSRLFGAVCANRLYIKALKKYNAADSSPAAFTEWTRNEYNRIIIKLLKMPKEEIEALLFAEGDDLEPSVRSFTEELWQTYADDYKFYAVLAASQGRYIMHTVCPYLESIGASVNGEMRNEISHLIWQYLGQSAGYGFAAAYLNPNETDPRVKETIQKYTTGV